MTDDEATAEDVTHDVLLKLLETRDWLEPATLASYAIVTARNRVVSLRRRGSVERRHEHRLYDARTPEDPPEVVVATESRQAMADAWAALNETARDALATHYLGNRQTAITGSGAARLHRARAALRLEYSLALHRHDLPTARCRPVLLALAARDRRRQAESNAAQHLLGCRTCQSLAPGLLSRRRGMAAVTFPLLLLWSALRRTVRQHPQITVAAAAGAAVAVSVAVVVPLRTGGGGRHPSTDADSCRVALRVNSAVTLHRATVRAVPADEGFVVRDCRGDLIWVHLKTGSESGPTIRRGMRLDLTGIARRDGPDLGASQRLPPALARRLDPHHLHVEATVAGVRVAAPNPPRHEQSGNS